MNRSSNLLNTGPLGSGESTLFVFIKAQLQCVASFSASLRGGFRLQTRAVSSAQANAVLHAGRTLRSIVQATATTATGVLHRAIPVKLAATLNAAATDITHLTRITRKFFSTGVIDATASVSAKLRKGVLLKALLTGVVDITAFLNESSRVRAALDRTVFIQKDDRVVVVPKGK